MNDQEENFDQDPELEELNKGLKEVKRFFFDEKEEASRRRLALLRLEAEQEKHGPKGKDTIDDFLRKNPTINAYIVENSKAKQQFMPSSQGVQERIVSPLHAKVDKKDFNDNGKLYTDEQFKQVKEWFAANPTAKHLPKNKVNPPLPYSAMRSGGQYYAVYKKIGSGAFGEVKLIQNQETKAFAIRKAIDIGGTGFTRLNAGRKEQINLEDTGQSIGEMTLRKAEERSERKQLPYVLGNKKRGGDQIVLAMELAPGNEGYERFVKNKLSLSNGLSTAEMLQVGLNFLSAYKTQYQDKRLINRDLKPDNAMFDEVTRTWRFIDAGPAIHEDEMSFTVSFSGTPGFIAPEMMALYNNPKAQVRWNRKADVFSLGFSLVEIFDFKKGDGLGSSIKTVEESELNTYFPDKEIRADVIAYLQKMTDANPEERPTVEEAMKFFEEKLGAFPEIVKTRRVAVFDINEYEDANVSDKKNMIAALAQADEVWMLDAGDPPKNDDDIGVLQEDLRRQGIRVGSSVFTSPDFEVKTGIEGIVELNEKKNDGVVRGLYFVTNENAGVSLDERKIHVVKADTDKEKVLEGRYDQSLVLVSKDRIQKIEEALDKELKRLERKYGEGGKKHDTARERYEAIVKYQKILKDPRVSFVQMEKELATLAGEMKATGRFMSVSTGAKKISKLNESLEKEHKLKDKEVMLLKFGKM